MGDVDLVDESVAKGHHPGKLDFGDIVGCVPFVSTDRFILVVVPEDGSSPVRVTVVQCVAVAAWILWVVGFDDLPADDPGANPVFDILDDRVTNRQTMV
mgnify:CR=1 FL=1